MTSAEWITAIAAFAAAAALAVLSIRSFRNRGFLLNNAYIYASAKERETMDKKPHYRQSAVVFLLLSIVFIIVGLSVILDDSRIDLLEIPLITGTLVYAVISSVQISKKEKKSP